MDTNQVKIPEIRSEVMRKDDERKGAGLGLLAKLGLGGGASAGGAGGFAAGGGLLAGKAGVVALILAGSSVAAGIGLIAFGDGSTRAPVAGSSVFAKAGGGSGAPGDSAEAFADSPAPAAGEVSGSLENFNKANQGAVQDPYAAKPAEEVKDSAAPVEPSPTAVPDNTNSPSQGTRPPAAVSRPKMIAGKGFGGSAGASGGSGASGGGALSARGPGGASADLSRGAAGASTAMRAGGRSAGGVTRRSSIMSGKGASSQLKAHSGQLRRSIGSSNLMQSGAVMDGGAGSGNVGGAGGAITGGGAGAGGRGVDSSPNASVSQNLKEVTPPPSPEAKAENKTPYQKEMMIAMGAMMGAMALLFISGMLSDKAKAASATPWVAAPLYAQAKNVAMIATALAAVATGIGLYIMTKQGQMMQGAMLTAVGGILTFQAGKAWITGSEAAKEAEAQSMGAAKSMAAETPGLQGATVQSVGSNGTVTFSNGQTAVMTPPASAAPGAGVVNSGYTLGSVTPPPAAPPVAPPAAAVNPVTGATLPPPPAEPPTFIPPNF